MLQVTPRPQTVHDYRLLPEEGPRFQLIEGELHMAPAPNTFHQVVSRNLFYLLMDFLEEHPIGEVFNAPFDVYLTETDVFQPDLCVFFRKQGTYLDERGATCAPWLVIEILSPSSRRHDRGPKREVYARCGARELWLIDPDKRAVEIFQLSENPEIPAAILTDRDELGTELLPGLKISLARVFTH